MIKRLDVLIVAICISVCARCSRGIHEDAKLNFTSLAAKYGHRVEEHHVVTEDQYVLKLFHVVGDARRPVLLVHGMVDSADTFMIRGNASLAIALVNNGYDVWAFNARGNRYSRSHRRLNPDVDMRFWDFSFHEMGYYDLPAAIDHVLGRTKQPQLRAIGHSQGNTVFYVLGSTRPEYNEKIKVMIALAPVCFLEHVKPPVSTLLDSFPVFDRVLRLFGMEEVFNDRSLVRRVFEAVCSAGAVSYDVCGHGLIFAISGSDPAEFEPEFLPVVVAHYPSSTSRKNGVHVGQVARRKRFARYDYGPRGNAAVYNASVPPSYDLGKVSMRIALFASRNDAISSIRDAETLRDRLPNVVDYKVLKYKRLNHLDHVWGRNMHKYLFPYIFSTLSAYD
ncbi:unnamed protein product, partial [Iphiclides podalirius]